MFCRICGKELNDGDMFCSNCGTSINQNSTSNNWNSMSSNQPVKNSNTKVVIAIVVSLLAILAIGGLIFYVWYGSTTYKRNATAFDRATYNYNKTNQEVNDLKKQLDYLNK